MVILLRLFDTRTRGPADSDLQGASFLDPVLVNGKHVDFHLVHIAGGIGADVMIVDPTAPSYVRRGLDEARLISDCEVAKRNKHCLLYTSPSPRDQRGSRMPSSA